MAIVRWKDRGVLTPWSALRDLEGPFNRLFSECFRELAPPERGWVPAVDLSETEDAYTLEVDLPGMKKEDIELAIVDSLVTIKGRRKSEREAQRSGYHCFERRSGAFQRSFEIPGGFNNDKVEARYQNGVLHVTLPKREEAKPKHIEVKVK